MGIMVDIQDVRAQFAATAAMVAELQKGGPGSGPQGGRKTSGGSKVSFPGKLPVLLPEDKELYGEHEGGFDPNNTTGFLSRTGTYYPGVGDEQHREIAVRLANAGILKDKGVS